MLSILSVCNKTIIFQTKFVRVFSMIKLSPFDLVYVEQRNNFQWCLHCLLSSCTSSFEWLRCIKVSLPTIQVCCVHILRQWQLSHSWSVNIFESGPLSHQFSATFKKCLKSQFCHDSDKSYNYVREMGKLLRFNTSLKKYYCILLQCSHLRYYLH